MVSAIIPTTPKELPLAKRCAQAVRDSTYKNTEVLIINEGKERSAQRNIGIQRAKGDMLLILDSDQIVSPCLIAECVGLMEKYDAVYIPEKIPSRDWFSRLRDFERQFYDGTAVDCVRFVKKPCPLFDEGMSGPEDSDWDRRVTGRRVISKNPFYHYDNVRLLDYIRKKAYYTKSMKRFKERNPNDRILKFRYRCMFIFLEKWPLLLKHPVMSMGLVCLLALRGYIYIKGGR